MSIFARSIPASASEVMCLAHSARPWPCLQLHYSVGVVRQFVYCADFAPVEAFFNLIRACRVSLVCKGLVYHLNGGVLICVHPPNFAIMSLTSTSCFVRSAESISVAYLKPEVPCALHILLRLTQFFGGPTKLLWSTVPPRGEDASPLLFRRMSRVPIFRFALLASLFEFK